MTALNLTDPANAIIKPDFSMYLQLEHPNATAGERISLSSLASLLAAGILSGGTVPTSTPTPARTLPPLSADFGQPSRTGRDGIRETAAQQTPAEPPA